MTEQPVGSDHRPTFLVTGATSGVGEAIATQLGERGVRVIVGARTPERGHAAAERIRSRVPDADLRVVAADLSLMRQVRTLAYEVLDTTPRLDGLILNAAVARSDLVLTKEGIETNFRHQPSLEFPPDAPAAEVVAILGARTGDRGVVVGAHSGQDGRSDQRCYRRSAHARTAIRPASC